MRSALPGLRLERELENLVQPAGQARHHRRVGALRQLPGGLTDALRDELPGAVVVGVRLEFDRHLHDAELRVRPDASHVRQTGQRDFERNRDARLELFRAHRRVLDDDVEHRRRQVGKHIPRQILEPEHADADGGREQQHDHRRLRERAFDQALDHDSVLVLAFAAGLVGFGFQQEGSFDHDGFVLPQAGQNLDLAAQIAAASDGSHLEACSRPVE